MRYLKSLPQKYHEAYTESLKNQEQLSSAPDLGLIDSILQKILASLENSEGNLWQKLNNLREQFDAYRKENDSLKATKVALEIMNLIRLGGQDFESRAELLKILQIRCKVAEIEQKRLVSMQQFISSEEATKLMEAMFLAINNNCDQATREAIATDFARLTEK